MQRNFELSSFLVDKNFRIFFLKNYLGFSLSFFCCFLILIPNIIWNFNNGWVTLQHTSDNANLVNMKIDILSTCKGGI